MDEATLRAHGCTPLNARHAHVRGMTRHIGPRATLVPDEAGTTHGMLMELTHAEIDHLYADPSVAMYRPDAVDARLPDGSNIAALCFNLPAAPRTDERNLEYAARLRDVARRLGLPAEYVDRLR
jgi:hypothetical protein